MKSAFFTHWIGYLTVLYFYYQDKIQLSTAKMSELIPKYLALFWATIVLGAIVQCIVIDRNKKDLSKIDQNYLIGMYITYVCRICFDLGAMVYGQVFYLKPIILMLFCAIITTFIVWEQVIKRRLTKLERLFE